MGGIIKKSSQPKYQRSEISFDGSLADRAYSLYIVKAVQQGKGRRKPKVFIGTTSEDIGGAKPRPPITRMGALFYPSLNKDVLDNRIYRYFDQHKLNPGKFTFEVKFYLFRTNEIGHFDIRQLERGLIWLIDAIGAAEVMNFQIPKNEPEVSEGIVGLLKSIVSEI